jgi:hypothetical protein
MERKERVKIFVAIITSWLFANKIILERLGYLVLCALGSFIVIKFS